MLDYLWPKQQVQGRVRGSDGWRNHSCPAQIRRSRRFDEPLSNLDAKSRIQRRAGIKELH